MNSAGGEHSEVSRIRAAYARRGQTVPKDRYSLFNMGNQLAHLELQSVILRSLKRFRRTDLERQTILDIGCGRGYWLRQFIQWGARPHNLFGVDLLAERIHDAKLLCPVGVTLYNGDASRLAFENHTFDLVLQFTVFTSILDPAMKKNVALEMARVLKPGGAILWYDYFMSNPSNPDVRGIKREEMSELFPEFTISLERITFAPPVGRAVGSFSPGLYRLLSATKLLCTHYLGLIQ
jgi:ubiquinone/menaquinone biosynthesis C-methylase UbiE